MSKAFIKRKLPNAPEPTRAAYKKPVVGYGKYVEVKELKAVFPKPLPFPKASEERKAKIEERKKERKEREQKIWTPERTEQLIKLFNKKMAYPDIAKEMGLTLYSINHQVHKLSLLLRHLKLYICIEKLLNALLMRSCDLMKHFVGDVVMRYLYIMV